MSIERSDLQAETEALREVQRAVPFNSISNMFVLAGQQPRREFGGNCLVQAAAMQEEISSRFPGTFVTFHNQAATDTRGHVVTVGDDGDDRLLYEVTGLARQPIRLEDIRRRGRLIVPTVPMLAGRCRQLLLQTLEPGTSVVMTTCDSAGLPLGTTILNVDRDIRMPPGEHPIDATAARKFRAQLHLHLLEPDDGKSEVDLDTRTGAMSAKKTGAEWTPEAHKKAFNAEMTRIAKALGVTRAQLTEFFREGWKFYKKLRPDYAEGENK